MEMPEDLSNLLALMKNKKSKQSAKSKFQDPKILKKGLEAYLNPDQFSVGDFVTQKENLDIYKLPIINHPAIVVDFPKLPETAEQDFYKNNDTTQAYTKPDIVLGMLIEGTFVLAISNSFRLRKLSDFEIEEYVEFMNNLKDNSENE